MGSLVYVWGSEVGAREKMEKLLHNKFNDNMVEHFRLGKTSIQSCELPQQRFEGHGSETFIITNHHCDTKTYI